MMRSCEGPSGMGASEEPPGSESPGGILAMTDRRIIPIIRQKHFLDR